jgi:hypothetical protein
MLVNRNGLTFVENKSPSIYRGSGLRFASYYKRVCTRCGWSFAGVRWKNHNHAECDRTILERAKEPRVDSYARMNLHGNV